MEILLTHLLKNLPVLFGLFFLGPLIGEVMVLANAAPTSFGFDIAPLYFGMIVGGAYGVFARVTGRWI